MQRVSLGTTDLSVSQLALGCMEFNTRIDPDSSLALIDTYIDAGGNFLDTANNYAFWLPGNVGGRGGDSERLIADWLRSRSRPSDLVIATKVGASPRTPGAGLDDIEGLSASAIASAVEGSLSRLGVDTIDLLYAHIDDRAVPLEESLGALHEQVAVGNARAIAVSNFQTWRLERAHSLTRANGWAPISAVQQRHTYLRPRPGTDFMDSMQISTSDEMLAYLTDQADITLVAHSPSLRGIFERNDTPLPTQYDNEDNQRRLQTLREIAAEHDAPTSRVLFAWMMQTTPAAIPVLGVSRQDQLVSNLAATELTLTAEQLVRLDHAGT